MKNGFFDELTFETKSVCGCTDKESFAHSVSFPVFQTSTFVNTKFLQDIDFSYTRCANPTREQLEKTAAILEGGKSAFAFSSGLAAVCSCFMLLQSGDSVLISDDVYGGTYRLSNEVFSRFGINFIPCDFTDISNVERHISKNVKMIFAETPTNPTMKVADIRGLSKLAKRACALLCVDNTFMTPVFQRPLDLGADIVLHSATKFISGHHDTLAGLVVVKNEELAQRLAFIQRTFGAVLSPFDCFLVLRGIKTLFMRMKKHEENAIAVAQYLNSVKSVEKVYFIGSEDHPQKHITDSQCSGYGGMISFRVKDKSIVKRALCDYDMIMFAESLGGVQTLITYPLTQTHASVPEEVRRRLGIDENLLRLSVGIENSDDIIKDLSKIFGE